MTYVVKWREHASEQLRQQECATQAEAYEWRAAVKAVGGVDLAIVPLTYAQAPKRKMIQIIDADERVWDRASETFA